MVDRSEAVTHTPSQPPRSQVARRGFIAGMATLTAGALLARDDAQAADGADTTDSSTYSTRGADVNGVVAIEEDGAGGLWSHTGSRGWSPENPPMRLRISRPKPDVSGGQHFMLTPYAYGLAMEYNGVVEVWTDDFSVHNNGQGGDVAGARLWVGNHDDTGGLMITAHKTGERYAEIVSQLFDRSSGGDLRLGVRGANDGFVFRTGAENAEHAIARIDQKALTIGPGDEREARVGEVGPQGQAGVAFGRDVPAAIYQGASGELRATTRLVAEKGIGVGGTSRASRAGKVVRKLEVFDADGASLGFVPIYDQVT